MRIYTGGDEAMSEIVDMCRREKETQVMFSLNLDKWRDFDDDVRRIVGLGWKTIKFLDNDGNLSSDFEIMPADKGGIYIFVLNPDIVPNIHTYIMYIGRAQLTANKNLKKRCKEYFKDMRPKIAMMRETWGKELYIQYLPLGDNETIKKVERELIRVIIPPFNDQIPDLYKAPKKSAWGG